MIGSVVRVCVHVCVKATLILLIRHVGRRFLECLSCQDDVCVCVGSSTVVIAKVMTAKAK